MADVAPDRPGRPGASRWPPSGAIGAGPTTFDLDGGTGGAVLLWITDLGEGPGEHR